MERHSNTNRPPRFNNGPNGCPFTSFYQLMLAAMFALELDVEIPARDYPCRLLGDWREEEGLPRGEFGNAIPWVTKLLTNMPDVLSATFADFLGGLKRHFWRRREGTRETTPLRRGDFYLDRQSFRPFLQLEGGGTLQENLQKKLDGSIGSLTVEGNVFEEVPKVLMAELSSSEVLLSSTERRELGMVGVSRDWQPEAMHLNVQVRGQVVGIRAKMVGFCCDWDGHYTAVVRYGSEWWYTDCLSPDGHRVLDDDEVVRLYKEQGHYVVFVCE